MVPGINTRSTPPGGQYINMGSTSFAAPFVTGALALPWSIFRNQEMRCPELKMMYNGRSKRDRHSKWTFGELFFDIQGKKRRCTVKDCDI